ncbi:MAG: P-loop NTPase fold protein [Gammaproteobacteria bacterium]|nr:P-loop NTPase fold protein [Gammaproteobacteria bacterium]
MDNDTPITEESEDKLRFGIIAEQLSNALVNDELAGEFVIGVEGSWGSGKSSLINLALEKLRGLENGPLIIKFSPWIVGGRNELLQQLFSEFKTIIDNLERSIGSQINSLLEQYEKIASPLASVAGAVEVLVAGQNTGIVSKFIKRTGKAASKARNLPLSELNSQLREKFKQFECNIIVFIDDIDRLEPKESVEVLRLVRAVTNFPKVIYLLAYDSNVLASGLENTINILDGKAYIDKIVQASFRVPMPDKFDLTNWMKHETENLFGMTQIDSDSKHALSLSVETWCDRFISTPRDIIRVLNATRLYVVPQKDQVYLADAIFLQIVRIKCPDLYDWIEGYLLWLHSQDELAFLDYLPEINNGRKYDFDQLDKIVSELVDKNETEKGKLIQQLCRHVPELENSDQAPYSQDQISTYSKQCRLASRYHFRLYFAFSVRSGDLSDAEISQFLEWCVEDKEKAENRAENWFIELSKSHSPQGVMMGEVLLNRILDRGNQLSANQIEELLLILGDSIDELVKNSRPDAGYADFVSGNKDQIIGLIKCLHPDQKEKFLKNLFENADSLIWLSGIVWDSILQGHSGFEGKPEDEWLLTRTEFKLVSDIYVNRLKQEQPHVILETSEPYFLRVLDAWYETGHDSDAMSWINRQSSDDKGFVNLLFKMTSWSNSTDRGVEYTIRTETLDRYFPHTSVMGKLERIKNDNNNTSDVREKASQLIEKIKSGS